MSVASTISTKGGRRRHLRSVLMRLSTPVTLLKLVGTVKKTSSPLGSENGAVPSAEQNFHELQISTHIRDSSQRAEVTPGPSLIQTKPQSPPKHFSNPPPKDPVHISYKANIANPATPSIAPSYPTKLILPAVGAAPSEVEELDASALEPELPDPPDSEVVAALGPEPVLLPPLLPPPPPEANCWQTFVGYGVGVKVWSCAASAELQILFVASSTSVEAYASAAPA